MNTSNSGEKKLSAGQQEQLLECLQRLGPYRGHRAEKVAKVGREPMARCFRYGALKDSLNRLALQPYGF